MLETVRFTNICNSKKVSMLTIVVKELFCPKKRVFVRNASLVDFFLLFLQSEMPQLS